MDMNKVEKSAYDISALLAEIEEMLIDSMMRTMESHIKDEMLEDINWAQWQAEMLKGIEEYKQRNKDRLGDYFSLIDEKIEEAIQRAYQTGMSDLEIELLNALRGGFIPPEGGVTGGFFHPNDGKINALIDAVTNDMGKVESSILRYTDDAYRKIIYNVQMYYNMGAVSLDKAIDMATKAFLGSGISCIRYKNGAMVNIKSWAEMALRTANTRAALLGAAKKRDEYGIHLVKISSHATACPKCVPYQGNVYVDDVYGSGTAEESHQTGYPLLSSAVDGGLFHPNCRNGCSTYYEGISRPPRNTPEDVQKEQIANYEKTQYENYCNRQAEKYSRLSKYAFDEDNKKSYKMRATEWKTRVGKDTSTKRLEKNSISSKINTASMFRNSVNKGPFTHLQERMSKKNIRAIAKEFDIDLSSVEISIDFNEELLRLDIAGRADSSKVGLITFFPYAFLTKEELVRTIFHERQHILQFKKYGTEYVQNNRTHFEQITKKMEDEFIEKLKKEGRLQ